MNARTISAITLALLCAAGAAGAQEKAAPYLWPIKNAEADSNILCKPQGYIERELNFGDLFIGAPLGTQVVAPVDGTIDYIRMGTLHTLTQVSSGGSTTGSFEQDSLQMVKDGGFNRYRNLSISLKTAKSGERIYLSGLRAVRTFKTGEKVKRGDVLGTVGYAYSKLPQPCIDVSISLNGKSADPMAPFGIATSFVPPQERTKTALTAEEAQQDFRIFDEALREGYPGLYDYISEAEWSAYTKATLAAMKAMSIADFRKIISRALHKISDSHLYLFPSSAGTRPRPAGMRATTMPSAYWGWIGDSLVVANPLRDDSAYYGRRIAAIDGIPADSLRARIAEYLSLSDGYIESYRDFQLAITSAMNIYFVNEAKDKTTYDVKVRFADGTERTFAAVPAKPEWGRKRMFSYQPFLSLNRYGKQHLHLARVADGVAYVGLTTFDLNDVERDELRSYFKNVCDSGYRAVLIDVRNNGGGNPDVVNDIFSYIAEKPFNVGVYSMVNKPGNFSFFRHTLNYSGVTAPFVTGYKEVPGKRGFYSYDRTVLQPDSAIRFRGRVVVLANERSFSASSELAGLVHRYRRGTIVGRETGSGYYLFNAMKFAQLRLPNSWVDINIPLVKVVLNEYTPGAADIPWGRGVMPDRTVPITLDMLTSRVPDMVLREAMKAAEN